MHLSSEPSEIGVNSLCGCACECSCESTRVYVNVPEGAGCPCACECTCVHVEVRDNLGTWVLFLRHCCPDFQLEQSVLQHHFEGRCDFTFRFQKYCQQSRWLSLCDTPSTCLHLRNKGSHNLAVFRVTVCSHSKEDASLQPCQEPVRGYCAHSLWLPEGSLPSAYSQETVKLASALETPINPVFPAQKLGSSWKQHVSFYLSSSLTEQSERRCTLVSHASHLTLCMRSILGAL